MKSREQVSEMTAATNLYGSITELIGNTPMVRVGRINPAPRVEIYLKLEGQNPTGSLKDRIAFSMIQRAEREGKIKEDTILLEPTSGNTGIALALICKIKGYRLRVVMPDNLSRERSDLLLSFGAEIIYSDGKEGSNGAIKVAHGLVERHPEYLMLDQYANPANPLAHYEGTGAEILKDLPEVNVFVAGLGTGGTLMGAGRRLKEVNPETRIIAVQPYPRGGLQGLRNLSEGYIPPILDLSLLDANEVVKDEDAFKTTRDLLHQEGIFAGISSGAVVFKALQVAQEMQRGVVVAILADGGWKYLSQRLWTEDPAQLGREVPAHVW